jgi:tetratricopeptide (TPR) repeat protein
LGGVGKSQLAIEYAHVLRAQSPETWILWIYASNEARFEQSVRSVLDQLRVRGRKDSGANIFLLLRFWLCDVTRGPWLVILDNADDARVLLGSPSASERGDRSVVGEARLDCIPRSNHGKVLVTSRTKESAKELVYWNDIITVEPMDEDQALALLRNKIDVKHSEQNASQLARELEFMPLALTQAAAFICQSEGRCSIQQYLDKLRECEKSEANILEMDKGDLRRDRESSNSIMLTWQVSFSHVRETNPSAADLLSLMSFFDRHAIPEALLHKKGCREVDCDIGETIPTANSVAGGERHERNIDSAEAHVSSKDGVGFTAADVAEEFERNITVLRNYSFVSLTTDVTMFAMHRLVQVATKQWLTVSREVGRWASHFIDNLNQAFPVCAGSYENWKTCRLLFPHAIAALHTEVKGRSAILWQASLLLRSGQYASAIGHYIDAEQMHKQSLETRRNMLGEEHPDLLTSMNNLAGTYSRQGRPVEAEELCLKVIVKRMKVLGEGHPDTLTSKGGLADTYFYRGRHDDAEKLQVEVMDMKRKVLGEWHLDTLTSMNNLALTYTQQGKDGEAEELHLKVIQKRKEMLGERHPHTLTSMNNLARTYLKQNRLGEAEKLQREVIEKERAVLGEMHPYTLGSKSSLAWIYFKQGRYEESETLHVEVIEKRKQVLGGGHPDTQVSMATLAYMLRALRRRKSALNLMSACAGKSPDVLGVDHHNANEYWRVKTQWEKEDSLSVGAAGDVVCSISEKPPVRQTLRKALAKGFK